MRVLVPRDRAAGGVDESSRQYPRSIYCRDITVGDTEIGVRKPYIPYISLSRDPILTVIEDPILSGSIRLRTSISIATL